MFKDGLKNKFGLNEWSGAIGDLGTILPLAFALVAVNGFDPPSVTIITFKITLSVNPWITELVICSQVLEL